MSDILKSIRRNKTKRPRRSKPQRWLPLALAAIAIALLAVAYAGVRAIVLHDTLRVARVEVSGIERLDAERVKTWLEQFKGRPILTLDLNDLRTELERVPGIESAVVARRLPNLIDVRISERTAIARARIGTRIVCCDAEGRLFVPRRELPGDRELPSLRGLATPSGETQLIAEDLPALRALEALARVTGGAPPAGTIVDLTPEDRILLYPGTDAAPLWLDRDEPGRNLETLIDYESTVARIARGQVVDLRFPHRLTIVPTNDRAVTR